MAHRRCDHLEEFVCLKAPSVLGQKMHVCVVQISYGPVTGSGSVTYRRATTDQLAFPTQPLSLGDERDAVAFLVDR